MPKIPIIMPQLGESIAEATIVALPCPRGSSVIPDQDILEVETNKATMSVTAPCAGEISEWRVELGQSYAVGAVLGFLDVSEAEATRAGLDSPSPSTDHTGTTDSLPPTSQYSGVQPTVRGLPVPAHAAGASFLSPRMKARMSELGLHAADLAGIAGSGAAGRVTIEDF